MLQAILFGSGLALASGIQPGPLQAFFLSSVARQGWRRTLPAVFSPLISDGPVAALALLVLNHLPPVFPHLLQVAGGLFLLYLAWMTFRQWRNPAPTAEDRAESASRTLPQAVVVNLLNPGPYIAWSLVLGPAVLSAWRQSPFQAGTLVAAFYTTMVAVLTGSVLILGLTQWMGPRGRRALSLVSAVILGGLGVYQLTAGTLSLLTGNS